jgi:hypothetical protein
VAAAILGSVARQVIRLSPAPVSVYGPRCLAHAVRERNDETRTAKVAAGMGG